MIKYPIESRMADQNSRSDRVSAQEDATIKHVKAPVAPLETITQVLERQVAIKDIRTSEQSDFVYGLSVEIDITPNCSVYLQEPLRKLGLYIETVKVHESHETLTLRRISRLLERMEDNGQLDHPTHPSENR